MDLDSDVQEIADPSKAQRAETIPASSLSRPSIAQQWGAPLSALPSQSNHGDSQPSSVGKFPAHQDSTASSASSLMKPPGYQDVELPPKLALARPSKKQAQDPLQVFTAVSLSNQATKSSPDSEVAESSDRQELQSDHHDAGTPPNSAALLASLLARLRKTYDLAAKPPFSVNKPVGNTGYRPGSIRDVVLATDDGRYPRAPIKRADLIYRSWNDRFMFATIELNGSLYIVKSVPGGASNGKNGGSAFKHWQGPQAGLSKIPIAFEDKGPIKPVAEKYQIPAKTRSSGLASGKPMGKKILRASKSIRHSDSRIVYNWAEDADDRHSHRTDRASQQKEVHPADTLSTDSSSSSDSDEDTTSAPAPATISPEGPTVKMEPSENHSLMTPATSIPRAFPCPQRYIPKNINESLDGRVKAKGLEISEIEKQLVERRDEGKTWQQVAGFFTEKFGVRASFSTWCSRHKRVTAKHGTLSGKLPGPAKPVIPSKHPRKTSDSSQPDDYSGNETEETNFRKPAKRTFRTSQNARPSFLDRLEAPPRSYSPRQRVASVTSAVAPIAIPISTEEISEADQQLLRWRDISKRPWPEIRQRWKKMTGQDTDETTLPNRYRNIKTNFKAKPATQRRRSQQEEFIPVSSLSTQNNGTQPSRFRSVNSTYPPASPSYFRDSNAAMGNPLDGATVPSIPGLDADKVNRTTLRVYNNSSFMPLRLSSCTTISHLFNAVLKACGLSSRREIVHGLKATFTWFPEGHEDRSMMMMEEYEETYEFFLEAISEAPCWERTSGRCTLNMEVVYHKISGEAVGGGSYGSWPASDVA